ncbi:glycogen synthase GlgA [Planococcus lenghuensis]|uniref:Glycogen synthase n=1 Tax=Planococcus lenghuensis TaxID=2213202 RepID=A0A1Q2KVE3_9BACL|nr:glycogen synthase GlgA [Planococcus lenghuensis]AQQ52170.1 starch synthase [Planococcus lenghuensis]
MNIVMAVAECVPFVKTGGLADVAGALPKALARLGHNVTVILPKYSLIPDELQQQFTKQDEVKFEFKGKQASAGIFAYESEGVGYLLLENDEYFAREGIYGQPDDAERFAFLNRGVLAVLHSLPLPADIVHVHDWHTAMIPFLLQEDQQYAGLNEGLQTVLTIHNLQFQGNFPPETFTAIYGMDSQYLNDDAVLWHGNLSMLKTGIQYADKVTAVSPTYRDEILTDQYGEGLQQVLRARQDDLLGIVNGLDTDAYDPAADPAIEQTYDASSVSAGKAANKQALQRRFGLPEQPDTPLIVMVSRLSGQKGIDVLEDTLPELVEKEDLQVIILGTGEERYERFLRGLAADHPDKVYAYIGFDEALAHLLYAGADIFLMPSHFEPCGLSQLISMRYGTVPVANKTGGLQDTVTEYDEGMQTGNGFLSDFSRGRTFSGTLKRCLSFYKQPEDWRMIQLNGMRGNYSWPRSAEQYAKLYERIKQTEE